MIEVTVEGKLCSLKLTPFDCSGSIFVIKTKEEIKFISHKKEVNKMIVVNSYEKIKMTGKLFASNNELVLDVEKVEKVGK